MLALWVSSLGCSSAPARPGDPEAGRSLYEQRCSSCHALPEPGKYSGTEWKGIMRTMGPRSGLDPGLRGDVLSYVLAQAGGQ